MIEPIIEGAATRVMSLRDGTKKMSKSDPSDMSRINLTDHPDMIASKIRKARTDSAPVPDTPEGLAGRPEAANLINIYAALSDCTVKSVIDDFGGRMFSEFKAALTDLTLERVSPVTAEMNRLMRDPTEIDRILGAGAERAAAIADPVLRQTRDILGMIRSR